jgi:Family of unknown function (DUF6502)
VGRARCAGPARYHRAAVTQSATPADAEPVPGHEPALLDAMQALLEPLAALAVARGLSFASVDELLRAAFVAAAHAAHSGLPEHRRVSRISAATGIHRREVTRLTQRAPRATANTRSVPSEVFARWTTAPEYLDAKRRPRVLPRVGPAPSFEALAQSVTRDMHPRSVLEELLRLGMAGHDAAADTVAPLRNAFVPRADRARMDAFLGANVGDHLRAAVANVLGGRSAHFEQALFADGLGEASLQQLRERVATQWRTLTAELVPVLEGMVAADAGLPDGERRRVRVGLYSFSAGDADAAASGPPDDPTPSPRPARRRRVPGASR